MDLSIQFRISTHCQQTQATDHNGLEQWGFGSRWAQNSTRSFFYHNQWAMVLIDFKAF